MRLKIKLSHLPVSAMSLYMGGGGGGGEITLFQTSQCKKQQKWLFDDIFGGH